MFQNKVTIYDPWANTAEVAHEYKLEISTVLPKQKFDAVVLGVAHKVFLEMKLSSMQKEISILYDVKGVIKDEVDGKL